MWIYRRISFWSACKFWKVAKNLLHYEICMPEIHFLYMHGCQMFLKIQNHSMATKRKIGCHKYQITPKKTTRRTRLWCQVDSVQKKKYWCHFFYHPLILVATQHTIFKKLKKHCTELPAAHLMWLIHQTIRPSVFEPPHCYVILRSSYLLYRRWTIMYGEQGSKATRVDNKEPETCCHACQGQVTEWKDSSFPLINYTKKGDLMWIFFWFPQGCNILT